MTTDMQARRIDNQLGRPVGTPKIALLEVAAWWLSRYGGHDYARGQASALVGTALRDHPEQSLICDLINESFVHDALEALRGLGVEVDGE